MIRRESPHEEIVRILGQDILSEREIRTLARTVVDTTDGQDITPREQLIAVAGHAAFRLFDLLESGDARWMTEANTLVKNLAILTTMLASAEAQTSILQMAH